jgi:hypothetical protein
MARTARDDLLCLRWLLQPLLLLLLLLLELSYWQQR